MITDHYDHHRPLYKNTVIGTSEQDPFLLDIKPSHQREVYILKEGCLYTVDHHSITIGVIVVVDDSKNAR